MSYKIQYNSPVILSFSLVCVASFLLNSFQSGFRTTDGGILMSLFSISPHFNVLSIFDWLSLFLYTAGHASFEHLLGNLSFILLIGPIVEEKYGSSKLGIMMGVTALVTAIINTIFFSTGLLGASGIVFMLIILVSFTNVKEGKIPLTFIMILTLYLGKEIMNMFGEDSVSQFAHIVGGLCGALFGFGTILRKKKGKD